MRVYFFVFILTFIAQFYPVKSDKQYWKRTVISFIPLFLFMALRKDFGVDDNGYQMFFNGVHRSTNIFAVNEHMEYGFTILNKILPSYQSLIILSSFLTVWAYSFLIYKFVPRRFSWLAVILIFSAPSLTIFFMISGIRNGMAASLLILSCYYIEQRKIIPVAILGVIATSIHTSALFVFTICYILGTNNQITKKQMFVWIAVMVALSFASLAVLANTALPMIEMFMNQYVGQVEGLAEIADERGFIGALVGIVFGLGIITYLFMMSGKSSTPKIIIQEISSIKYKYALLLAASFTIGILGGRMTQYWIYFFIVAVTCMVAYWKNPLYKFGFLLLVLYYFRVTYVSWTSDPEFAFHYQNYTSIIGNF